jgi:hypothetical protein
LGVIKRCDEFHLFFSQIYVTIVLKVYFGNSGVWIVLDCLAADIRVRQEPTPADQDKGNAIFQILFEEGGIAVGGED